MLKMLSEAWMVGPSVADVLRLRCQMESHVTEDVGEEVVVEEEEDPSIPGIPAMNVVNQVTMPETVVEEVGDDAHHHLIGHVDDPTLEVGLAPGVGQDMDLRRGEAPGMTRAHDPGLYLENAQSHDHHQ